MNTPVLDVKDLPLSWRVLSALVMVGAVLMVASILWSLAREALCDQRCSAAGASSGRWVDAHDRCECTYAPPITYCAEPGWQSLGSCTP